MQEGGVLVYNASYWIYAIVPAYNGGEYYWAGWRRDGNTSVFQSTDEYNISDSYHYWKENNPIEGINCVGFDGEKLEFLSLECNTNHTVVCEYGK